MASQFTKIGPAFYRQDNEGRMYAVTDTDTLTGLKSGQLPYQAIETSRGLTFAGKTTEALTDSERSLNFGSPPGIPNAPAQQGSVPSPYQTPAPAPFASASSAAPAAPTDIGALLKQKLIDALTGSKGASSATDLEVKRQEVLRKQLLSAPYSAANENNLTGAQKLALMRDKGAEYDPILKGLEEQIIQAKNGDAESLAMITKIAAAADSLGISLGGTQSGYQSALGKEYADYVANEKASGNNKPMSLNDYANMDANRKRAVTVAGNNGLNATTASKVATIASSFDTNQITKDYNTVQNKLGSMNKIISSGVGGPGDLALVFEFMKALDPNSVVRETEYATAAKSGNIFAGWAARFNGYLKENGGFLPPSVQKAFVEIMQQKYNVSETQYNNYRNEQIKKINKWTGSDDGADYLSDFGAATSQFTDTNTAKMIKVKRRSDGVTGSIPESEYDAKLYLKL